MVQPWPDEEVLTHPVAVPVDGVVAMRCSSRSPSRSPRRLVISVVSVVRRFRRGRFDRAAAAPLAGGRRRAVCVPPRDRDRGRRAGSPPDRRSVRRRVPAVPGASASPCRPPSHCSSITCTASRWWRTAPSCTASLAATITAIYAVVVAGVGAVVGRGDRAERAAAVAATAVAAVVFQPARRRAQRFADRLIYGDRASPYELVATFTERLDEASLAGGPAADGRPGRRRNRRGTRSDLAPQRCRAARRGGVGRRTRCRRRRCVSTTASSRASTTRRSRSATGETCWARSPSGCHRRSR